MALACAEGRGDAPGVVIVSHDEELLESACDRIVEVRGNKLHHYVGAEPPRLRYIGPSTFYWWLQYGAFTQSCRTSCLTSLICGACQPYRPLAATLTLLMRADHAAIQAVKIQLLSLMDTMLVGRRLQQVLGAAGAAGGAGAGNGGGAAGGDCALGDLCDTFRCQVRPQHSRACQYRSQGSLLALTDFAW